MKIKVDLGSRGIVDVEDGGDVDLDVEEVYLADGTRLTEQAAEQWAAEIRAKGGASTTKPGLTRPA